VLLDWAGRVTIREKSPADLVTEADIAAQEAVRQTIATAFPNHRFVGEETAETAAPASMDALLADGTSYLWIVDPLDGTTNYAHNVPHYACSVAAVRGGEVFAAAVYNPTGDECFTAVHGGGALLNGAPIHVSRIEKLARALVAASFPPHLSRDGPEIDNLLRVLERAQAIRRTGSAALNMCYVAAGRLDGYWATGTHAWDIAAGILLVREAGGVVTALGGGRFQLSRPQPVATGTKSLNAELSALLASDGQGGDRSAHESRGAAPGA
jgi:myo-inositol-1(or 4)-monophosphatase